MSKPKDITPDDSVVTVWLDTTPQVPTNSPKDTLDVQAEARSSAIKKLKLLGLTDAEITAIVA